VELYTALNGQNVTINLPLPQNPPNSYALLVQNFVRHLDGDPSAEIVTPEQALVSVRIIDAIGQSAESGREVTLAGK
jgi:predicted dehydrogenase